MILAAEPEIHSDINLNFSSARKKIAEGEIDGNSKHFEDAIHDLGLVVETLLNGFYHDACRVLSEEEHNDIETSIKGYNRKDFKSLTLGLKMDLFRNREDLFIEKTGRELGVSLQNFKVLRDGDFVEVRNRVSHKSDPNKSVHIDVQLVVRLFDLVAFVLTDLGYEGFYSYDICKFNEFVDEFTQAERRFATVPETGLNIDASILSDFADQSAPVDLLNTIMISPENILITGEGGIGKSTVLQLICRKFHEENTKFIRRPHDDGRDDFLPIPVMILASKLKVTRTHRYVLPDFIADIERLSRKNAFDIIEESDKLSRSYVRLAGENTKPVFLLLLDGFNEITVLNDEISADFLSIFEFLASKKIQIVITSRTIIHFPDTPLALKEISAKGLGKEKITAYLLTQLSTSSASEIRNRLEESQKLFDVLKNPMLLTLFAGYQYGMDAGASRDHIRELREKKRLTIIESPNICKSYILWNFIQYKYLYDNIYRPLIEERVSPTLTREGFRRAEREQEIDLKIVSEYLPKIAWEMVSSGLFRIYRNDLIRAVGESSDIDRITECLTKNVCLLRYEADYYTFDHQNYRDFFAACHYISGYMQISDSRKDETKIRERLRSNFIPADIKTLVGELLGELEDERSLLLKSILTVYQVTEDPIPVHDYAVENIFEIYKSLDTLNLNEFINTDLERLNFNDIDADKIIRFVQETLDTITVDHMLTEIPVFGRKTKSGSLQNLYNLFMLSARVSNNLREEDIQRIFTVWFLWVRDVYSNRSKRHSQGTYSRFFYYLLSKKEFTIFLIRNVIYYKLAHGNIGIGENGILTVFADVSDRKRDYLNLMEILKTEGQGVDNTRISDSLYDIASRNNYAANFVCFLLDYYLFQNLDDGLVLISRLQKRMHEEQDPEKKILIRFRMMSGLNYCVQESWCHKKYSPDIFRERFKPIMNELLELELNDFNDDIARDYRSFKYQYYFPFGILFSFDNGIGDDQTIRATLERVFPRDGPINLPLYQKLILDIACTSTGTFFVQNEVYSLHRGEDEIQSSRYLGRTFDFFEDLIFKFYPVSFTSPYEEDPVIWESLVEALSLLYSRYPLKTEKFLDRVNKEYLENGKAEKRAEILKLKNNLKSTAENIFVHLCQAQTLGKDITINKFVENYQNVLVFADLANNLFISFPEVTKTLTLWGENSFYKYIDDYKKDPKKFISQTLREVISLCEEDWFYAIHLGAASKEDNIENDKNSLGIF